MIRTITEYLWQIHHNRPYYELCLARKRALRLLCAIFIALTIGVIAWILRP